MIDAARAEGAQLATGGGRLGGEYAAGCYVEPTVLVDVDPGAMIAQCEVFGPVLAMMPFRDDDEAVQMANATEYGLAAYVQTNDLTRAHRIAARLEAGNIWVNGFRGIPTSVPFGGTKGSGYGRIGGKWGIAEFTRPKNVWIGL
jgi:acyl-CoA reductase-like NAD-dependent aldehyde dehydrogenase